MLADCRSRVSHVELGVRMVGSELNLMQRNQGEKKRGGIGRERGNACKRSQKVDRSGILDSSVLPYWQPRRPGDEVFLLVDYDKASVNAQVPVTRNAIGIICYRITWTSKLL